MHNISILMMALIVSSLSTAHADQPLKHMNDRMPSQNRTMICGCDITRIHNELDTSSCSMPQSNLVLKPLIPGEWIAQWMSHLGKDTFEKNYKKAVNDPIINAYFTDEGYDVFRKSTGVIEGTPKPGFLGGCSINIAKDNSAIFTGSRLGVIARAALYIEMNYSAKIPTKQKELFLKYNERFMPSSWEVNRNQSSYAYKGTWNPLISTIESDGGRHNLNDNTATVKNIESTLDYLINRKYK